MGPNALNILMTLIAAALLVWSIRSGGSQRGAVKQASWPGGRPPIPPRSMPKVKTPREQRAEDYWDSLDRCLKEFSKGIRDTTKLQEKIAKDHYDKLLEDDLIQLEIEVTVCQKAKLKSDLTSLSTNRINKKLEEQRRKILEGL